MILLLAACSAPDDSLTWVNAYEVLVANSDTNVLDLRLMTTNTGVLSGMGHARGEVGRRKESSIRLGYDAMPVEVEVLEGGLRVGPDYIERNDEGWQVRFREGSELDGYRDLRMAIKGSGFEVPPQELEGWTHHVLDPLGTVSGALMAGGRQRFLKGPAVVMHRYGDAPPALDGQVRQAIYALDRDLSVGVDQVGGDVVGWALIDGELHTGEPVLTREERHITADFQPELPLIIQVLDRAPRVVEDPLENLTSIERHLVEAGPGAPIRTVSGGLAQIQWKDQLLTAPALTLQVEYE